MSRDLAVREILVDSVRGVRQQRHGATLGSIEYGRLARPIGQPVGAEYEPVHRPGQHCRHQQCHGGEQCQPSYAPGAVRPRVDDGVVLGLSGFGVRLVDLDGFDNLAGLDVVVSFSF